MMEYWSATPALAAIKISGRCRKLLDKAVIAPENLKHFYRTYRLPVHPFFPLFFSVKREYLTARADKAARNLANREKRVALLPAGVRKNLRFCAEVEKRYHPRGEYPVWTRSLWPGSLKRLAEYEKAGPLEWQEHYRRCFRQLETRYRGFTPAMTGRLLACLLLGCLPDQKTLAVPPAAEIRRRFRTLSKQHHPDAGGDGVLFVRLKEAEELLLGI
jgi:hypothetical protein